MAWQIQDPLLRHGFVVGRLHRFSAAKPQLFISLQPISLQPFTLAVLVLRGRRFERVIILQVPECSFCRALFLRTGVLSSGSFGAAVERSFHVDLERVAFARAA